MTTEPLRGKELMRAVINKIIESPESWDQTCWHSPCKTKHCIAGWAQILGGGEPKGHRAQIEAQEFLGLTKEEANDLFDAGTPWPHIYEFAKRYIAGEPTDFSPEDSKPL